MDEKDGRPLYVDHAAMGYPCFFPPDYTTQLCNAGATHKLGRETKTAMENALEVMALSLGTSSENLTGGYYR